MGGEKNRMEKARLEAFLAAVPGEYCGFGADGSIAYSQGFCAMLGVARIETVHDVQAALKPSDAMALEGLFHTLQQGGGNFCIPVQRGDGKAFLKLCGTRGADAEGTQHFHILWLEDISAEMQSKKSAEEEGAAKQQEILRLQAAFDHLPVPVWMRDSRTDLIWCNKTYAAWLESTPASVIADQKELPLSAKKAQGAGKVSPRTLAQTAFDQGAVQILQSHAILSGARHLLEIQESPVSALSVCVGFARDITREEELEAEQRRSATANRELLEHLGSAIAMFNADQKIEFFNSAFAQLWHLEEGWLNTGPKLGDIMEKLRETRRLPEQADFRNFKQGWLAMFTRLIGTHEEMLYLPDDRALRMLAIPHPLGGLMMTFEDVTSSLQLESSYNTLIAVQRETLDNLAEAVAVFGGDGRLKLSNPSFARLWSLNPEDLDGSPHISRIVDKMKGFFPTHTWAQDRESLIALGLARQEKSGRLPRTDQSLVDYATVPLPDGGVLVAFTDVTASVRVETALRERNVALETAERVKLDFLANVSYQLRTPLNAIMGFAEILDKEYFGTLNEKQREYTSGLQEAGSRLVGLIDDILDLSSIEAGYMELDQKPVDVHVMLLGLEEMVRDWAGTKRVAVRLESTPDVGMITGDARRLKQVLINLIRNAISFTPEGGAITLGAQKDGEDGIMIHVTDTGPGIPEEDRDRLFEPFERGSGSDAGRGAGLGLTLVRNIITLHGGTVRLNSEIGKGTQVVLALPRTEN
jgi:signal transduction histidine kinase